METNKKNNKSSILKRWGLPAAIVVLTVVLMIIFKQSQQGYETVQEQGRNLVTEYTNNLKPFDTNNKLSNEDVFNFAHNNVIPIDKEKNKSIYLQPTSTGEEIVVTSGKVNSANEVDYQKYVDRMKFNERDKSSIDSILNSYKSKLNKSIYYDDKNTVAVDPSIAVLHRALNSDLISYSFKKYGKEIDQNLAASLSKIKIPSVGEGNLREFIVVAPDTAFECELEVPEAEVPEMPATPKIVEARPVESARTISKAQATKTSIASSYSRDSNSFRFSIPNDYFKMEGLADFDSVSREIERASELIGRTAMNYEFFDDGKFKFRIDTPEGPDSINTINLQLDFKALSKLIGKSVGAAMAEVERADWNKFNLKMDSLALLTEKLKHDSTAFIKLEQITKKLEKLREERENKRKR